MKTDLVPMVQPGQIQDFHPEPEYLNPVMDLATAKRRLEQFQSFVQFYLKLGEDYGTIPGTKQRTLLKPGADKLCELYGLSPSFPGERQKSVEDWSKSPPYIKYTATCVLTQRRSGVVMGECMGSCNSWETKYKYRWKNNERVINTEISDQDNTLLKMAEKRALVGAVIAATRSSGIFTQDIEDMPREEQEAATQPKRRGRPPAQAQTEAQKPTISPQYLEASLAGFIGCKTAADVEKYHASEFEQAKKAGDTAWMSELQKAKVRRREELRAGQPRQEPEQLTMTKHGVGGVFPKE